MGALSDRIGRRPLLLTFTIVTILTAYPALAWLVVEPTFGKMLIVLLWLSFLYASYNGAMVVALTEVVPANVRTAGFSLAYSLATALFGGFTPAVSTALIEFSGDKAAPATGCPLPQCAVCSLLSFCIVAGKRVEGPLHSSEHERVIVYLKEVL
jgi:MHS family citrate/tricarballylate:H+ symporter-like MFS transporter